MHGDANRGGKTHNSKPSTEGREKERSWVQMGLFEATSRLYEKTQIIEGHSEVHDEHERLENVHDIENCKGDGYDGHHREESTDIKSGIQDNEVWCDSIRTGGIEACINCRRGEDIERCFEAREIMLKKLGA